MRRDDPTLCIAILILAIRAMWETFVFVRWACRSVANLKRPKNPPEAVECMDLEFDIRPVSKCPKTNFIETVDPERFDEFLRGEN